MTPEKASTVTVALSNSSTNEIVVVVNTRTSSAMRWSGFSTTESPGWGSLSR
jgi:hypothetical protein